MACVSSIHNKLFAVMRVSLVCAMKNTVSSSRLGSGGQRRSSITPPTMHRCLLDQVLWSEQKNLRKSWGGRGVEGKPLCQTTSSHGGWLACKPYFLSWAVFVKV